MGFQRARRTLLGSCHSRADGKSSSADESLVEERTEMKKWAKLLAHLAGKRMEDALIREKEERVILELIDLGLLDDFPSSPGDSRDINTIRRL